MIEAILWMIAGGVLIVGALGYLIYDTTRDWRR